MDAKCKGRSWSWNKDHFEGWDLLAIDVGIQPAVLLFVLISSFKHWFGLGSYHVWPGVAREHTQFALAIVTTWLHQDSRVFKSLAHRSWIIVLLQLEPAGLHPIRFTVSAAAAVAVAVTELRNSEKTLFSDILPLSPSQSAFADILDLSFFF